LLMHLTPRVGVFKRPFGHLYSKYTRRTK
jgi:hypothetical protein